MTKEEILEIGIKKRKGDITDSWDSLLLKYKELPFKNGNSFRKYVSRHVNVNQKQEPVQLSNNNKLNIEKQKIQFRDERNAFKKEIREYARYENLIKILTDSIEHSNLPKFELKKETNKTSEYFMVACLSDVHYGILIDNAFNTYNPEICQKRLEQYAQKIVNIANNHDISNLVVLGLADWISGSIHRSLIQYNQKDSITQIQNVSELISNFLFTLCNYFTNVTFASTFGNHGRIDTKENSIYAENLDKIPFWYIKARLQNVNNIDFIDENFLDGVISVNKYNKLIYGVHGDVDTPSKIVSDFTMLTGENPNDIYMGHLHHFETNTFGNTCVIQSGCLCGADNYSVKIRKVSPPCQTVKVYTGEDDIIYNVKLD